MRNIAYIVGLILAVLLIGSLLLRPGFYINDSLQACGIVVGRNERLANQVHNQSCICQGKLITQMSEYQDEGKREYCEGFGISIAR